VNDQPTTSVAQNALYRAENGPREGIAVRNDAVHSGTFSANTVAATLPPAQSPPGSVLLENPIRRGDQVISSLTLRKPDAGTLRGIKLADLLQMDVGALITLLPRISTPTLTAADAAKLDPVDLVALATEVGNFFLTKAQRDFPSA
jgi:hypothetical protein